MTRAERRAVLVLGAGQCVNWGVLYYAFGALVLPLERALATSRAAVAGAFSVSLVVAAVVAPAIGRRLDEGRGPRLLLFTSLMASGCLVAWPFLPGLVGLYVTWIVLGLAAAGSLYEPAFAIVGRHFDDPADRLRAIAAVTLFGGLASTCFVPATTALEQYAGWRGASWGLAVCVAAAALAVRRWALPLLAESHPDAVRSPRSRTGGREPAAEGAGLRTWIPGAPLVVAYGFTSLAATALVTNLAPALVERGYTASGAAWIAGLIGVMQLPGRTLIFSGRLSTHPVLLLTASLALQGVGLGVVAGSAAPGLVSFGVTTFALGAGVNTLVRPQLVQVMYGLRRAGYINGILARTQNLARAGGPVVAVTLYDAGGYALVFGASALGLAGLAAHWWLVRARSL
jgi:predicted MFS family arabinose efflux permease